LFGMPHGQSPRIGPIRSISTFGFLSVQSDDCLTSYREKQSTLLDCHKCLAISVGSAQGPFEDRASSGRRGTGLADRFCVALLKRAIVVQVKYTNRSVSCIAGATFSAS